MFDLLHLPFSMQSSIDGSMFNQLSLNHVAVGTCITSKCYLLGNMIYLWIAWNSICLCLRKLNFNTHTQREILWIIQYQFLFEFMLCVWVWMPFILVMHTEFCCIDCCCCWGLCLLPAFHICFCCCSICLEHVMQFNSSDSTKEFHSVARVRVQIIRWIFCAFRVRVYLLNIFSTIVFLS